MSNPVIPRYYYRIVESFNYIYGLHLGSYDNYKSNNRTLTAYEMFQSIKRVFVIYREALSDILKFKGIKYYYPTDILKYFKENDLISDADDWLDFIKLINYIVSENITNTDHEIFDYIVEKYIEAPHVAKENIDKLRAVLPEYKFPETAAEWRDDLKPDYIPEEWGIGITQEMFNIIITYFKSKPEIKNVWIYGSRVKGLAKKTSDIDMVVDAATSREEFTSIYNELVELRIPYTIDSHTLKEELAKEYKIRDPGRIVYRRKDFFDEKLELQNLPRYYYRITQKFYEKYTIFQQEFSKYDMNNLTNADVVNFFKPFKDIFQTYWQCLSDVLKYDGITVLFPDEVFKLSQKKGLISDAEIWLDFIKILDLVIIHNNTPRLYPLLHYIFDKYVPQLNSIKSNLDNIISNLPNYEYFTSGTPNPEQKAIYRSDILGAGVTAEMYNTIMSYFKSNPYIKKVWAFGSRVKGEARLHSDIDLAMDFPLEYKNEVENDLIELRIPYFLDGKNIYDPENKKFLSNMFLGTHILIYSREDFVK